MTELARSLVFHGERRVSIDRGEPQEPGPGEVLVRARRSAISAGTERLFYRAAGGPPNDPTLAGPRGSYPLRYGYALVGTVAATGAGVEAPRVGQRVFAYAPHQSHAVCRAADVVELPSELDDDAACLLASMETAVTLLMDGAPVIGERVAVIGLGTIGALTCGLAAHSLASEVVAVDPVAQRRSRARELAPAIGAVSPDRAQGPCDLAFEVSGRGAGLQLALDVLAARGRIVAGSWFDDPRVALTLDGRIHRSRQSIAFSQVSTLPPALAGRFDRSRRHAVAVHWLRRLPVSALITHRVDLDDADDIYRALDERPADFGQVVFTYE